MSWRQWFTLLFIFLLYLILGGVVFMQLESPEEDIRLGELNNLKHIIYDKLIMCETNVSKKIDLVGREEVWIQIAEQINQPTLINNHSAPPKKWTFYNSFFVAVTVLTTIGYGHLAPSSASGRLFCIFFALIGVPLNGIIFAGLGDLFGAKLVSRSNNRSFRRFSTVFVVIADVLLYFIPGLVVFLVIPAGIFSIVEGWNYIDSFYYAFITLTTIGFGDFVSGQNYVGRWTWAYRSFIIIWILFGLGYFIMVINIITKGLRSRLVVAPVVALERKMAIRIRATRKTLSKDAIALRQLLNQINVLKIKRIWRPARMGLYRTYSQPSLYYEENMMDKDFRKQFEVTESSGFNNNVAMNYIDRDDTDNNTSYHKPLERSEFNEDPVELLTRLASVLCDENEDADLSCRDTSTFEIESHTKNHKEVDMESAFQRIRRSFHLSKNKNNCTNQSSCLPPSPKLETNVPVNSMHHFTNRRVRHLSENHNMISDFNGAMNRNQLEQLETQKKSANPHEFKRSFSERISPNQSFSASSFQFTSFSNRPQLKRDFLITGAICNPEKDTQTDFPNASVIEFCDILDSVSIQFSKNGKKS